MGLDFVLDIASAIKKGMTIASGGNAGDIFGMMLDMCGNEGQVTLVSEIGAGGVEQAFEAALFEGEDPAGILSDMTSYPEVIEGIIEEAASAISDAVAEVKGSDSDTEEAEASEEFSIGDLFGGAFD